MTPAAAPDLRADRQAVGDGRLTVGRPPKPSCTGLLHGCYLTQRLRTRRPLNARLLHSGVSAVEHRPADVVSQPLIIQDQFADRVRELFSLPSTLEPPSVVTLAFRSGCTRRLDRVGRRSELVRSDVRYRRGLAGGIGGMAGGPA